MFTTQSPHRKENHLTSVIGTGNDSSDPPSPLSTPVGNEFPAAMLSPKDGGLWNVIKRAERKMVDLTTWSKETGGVQVATIGGVPYRLGVFAPLVAAFLVLGFSYGFQNFTFALTLTTMVFMTIVIHETGHALAAVRGGLHVNYVSLFCSPVIGGLCSISGSSVSEGVEINPRRDFKIALAGPMCGVLSLTTVAVVSYLTFGYFVKLDPSMAARGQQVLKINGPGCAALFLAAQEAINLVPVKNLTDGYHMWRNVKLAKVFREEEAQKEKDRMTMTPEEFSAVYDNNFWVRDMVTERSANNLLTHGRGVVKKK